MASAGTVSILIRAIDKTKEGLGKAEQGFKKFTEKVKSLSAIQLGALAGMAYGLEKIVMGASDINEAVNKTKVVFEEASSSVINWAMKQANAWGMTRDEALDYAGSLGALLKSTGLTNKAAAEMTLKLEKVAADMASIYNLRGGVSEALDKIKSGLVGMSIPLRDVGILLSDEEIKQKAVKQGLVESTKELTQQQKVLLRYQEIIKQSTILQGDFQRTSKDLANSTRILKAEIQDSLKIIAFQFLPVVKDIILALRGAVELFNKLPMPIRTATVVIGMMASAIRVLKISVSSLTGPLGIALGIITVLATAYVAYKGAADKAKESTDEFRNSIVGLNEAQTKLKMAEVKKQLEDAQKEFDNLKDTVERYEAFLREKIPELKHRFGLLYKVSPEWKQLSQPLESMKERMKDLSDTIEMYKGRQTELNKHLKELQSILGNIPDKKVVTVSVVTDFQDTGIADEWYNNFIKKEKKAYNEALADVRGFVDYYSDVLEDANNERISRETRLRATMLLLDKQYMIKQGAEEMKEYQKTLQKMLNAFKTHKQKELTFSEQVSQQMGFAIKNLIADEAIGWVDRAWERSFGKANSLLQQFAKMFVKVMAQVAALELVKGLFKGLGIAVSLQSGGIVGYQNGGFITAQTGFNTVGSDIVPILATPGEAVIPADVVNQNRVEIQNLIYGNPEEKQDTPVEQKVTINLDVQAWDGSDVLQVVSSEEFREAMKKAIANRDLNFKMQHGKLELI